MRIYRVVFAAVLLYGVISGSCQSPKENRVNVIAHRGGIIEGYPENTLKAFRRSIDHGVDCIELDLRVTSDGKIVIIHDETLERTTSGKGKISDHSLKELKALDAGYGERIPTIYEVFQIVTDTGIKLLLDIKFDKNLNAAEVLNIVNEFDMKSMVIFGIRSLEDLAKFHELDSEITTLGFISGQDQIEDFVENGIDIIRLKQSWIEEDPGLVAFLQKQDMSTWTTIAMMSDGELLSIINTGIEGIIYDNPEQLQHLLRVQKTR